ITEANDAFLGFLGYGRDDVRRGALSWRTLIPPEQLHLSERALDEIRASGVCGSYETEALRADGARIPIICAGAALDHPFRGAGVSWVIDISQRKRVERELRESVEVIDTVNRIGQRLVAELDLGHLVQEVTDAATRLSGAQLGAFFYNVLDGGEVFSG